MTATTAVVSRGSAATTPTISAAELTSRLGEAHAPTPEQTAVIEAPLLPRAIVAGAGSGKTQTMGLRVAWLVANGLVPPVEVLGLTFTRKAAGELSARVRRLLRRLLSAHQRDPFLTDEVVAALGCGDPVISTYHGYAAGLVDEHGLRIGVEPASRLLGEALRWQYTQSVVGRYDGPMDAVDRAVSTVTLDVMSLAGELSEHLVAVDDVRRSFAAVNAAVLALPTGNGSRGTPRPVRELLAVGRAREQLLPLVEGLAERKRALTALDFGDQVALAARLASDCPEVGRGERQRYSVVLLDEYQDTGEAQRRLLAALFGDGFPVVAVGDPRQSIYGWRGASAGNLERFPRDFASAGAETPVNGLTVSFRNGEGILRAANRLAADIPLRASAPADLRAGPGREGRGQVLTALFETIEDEAAWVSDRVVDLSVRGVPWGEMAVLSRKRSTLPIMEARLRAAGVPCEVVGLGGLLLAPEILDVVATLRVLVDPLAGSALSRLLTGPRWRVGPRDLAALGRRARHLASPSPLPAPAPAQSILPLSLVDALDDLGSADRYSAAGYQRLVALRDELRELRREVGAPLPELLTSVIGMLRLDVELAAHPGRRPIDARANLARLLDEAEDFAGAARSDLSSGSRSADAGLSAFIAYLDAAQEHERGLELEVADSDVDRVQLLTIHAAKGLEWDAVFVVGMTDKVFPVEGQAVADWTKQCAALPFDLRGDRADLPRLELGRCTDQKQVAAEITAFQQACKQRSAVEERRLAYVAVTRARELLACSGFWWDSASRPRGPSVFLSEIRDVCPDSDSPWITAPEAGAANPLTDRTRAATWPLDPWGDRRPLIEAAAELVESHRGKSEDAVQLDDPVQSGGPAGSGQLGQAAQWAAEVELLLAERRRLGARDRTVLLPESLSVSNLVALRRDPEQFARRLRRPVPSPPSALARRGTRFHAWLEERWGQQRLLDIDELPGAADESARSDEELGHLQEAFAASEWWDRRPSELEFPFELPVAGILLRGRIDAVFTDDPAGKVDVVDWKTGEVPGKSELQTAAIQLAAYRLAWHEISGVPLEQIRAAFHYVKAGRTMRPADLLDAEGLAELLRSVPEERASA